MHFMKDLVENKDQTGIETKTKSSIEIKVGDLYIIDKVRVRIIGLDLKNNYVFYCNIKKSPRFQYIAYNEILFRIKEEDIVKLKEEHIYANEKLATEKEIEKVNKKEKALIKVVEIYSPSFIALQSRGEKEIIQKLAKELGLKYDTFRKLVNKYIQSGFNRNCLFSKSSRVFENRRKPYSYSKKTGRKRYENYNSGIIITPEIKAIFEQYIEIYLKNPHFTIKNVFNMMNDAYFSTENPSSHLDILKPSSERPSYTQFTYYLYNSSSYKDRKESRLGIREFRNNHRMLKSDTQSNSCGPGDRVEIDAWECPVYVVDNEVKTKVLGKPVLYAMIDTTTKMILAASLSFENNSNIGLTSLFLNLALTKDDSKIKKEEILSSYNICNQPGILPREVVSDRGSDFISKDFEKVLDRLNINHRIAPAATGSYKGNIEQLFNQLNILIKPHLLNLGYVTDDYGSKHTKEACITINDLARVLHDSIIAKNIKFMDNYKPTKDMVDKNIKLSPIGLWDYYISFTGNAPRKILDTKQYAYDLMCEGKAKISRLGMSFDGLVYDCSPDKELYDKVFSGTNKNINIRYDPRDTSAIYYIREGQMFKANINKNLLSNSSYAGISWYEYRNYKKQRKEISKSNTEFNENIDILHARAMNEILYSDGEFSKAKNQLTDIRKNRIEAKNAHTHQNSIANKINLLDSDDEKNPDQLENVSALGDLEYIDGDYYEIIDEDEKEVNEDKAKKDKSEDEVEGVEDFYKNNIYDFLKGVDNE